MWGLRIHFVKQRAQTYLHAKALNLVEQSIDERVDGFIIVIFITITLVFVLYESL